MNRLISIFIFGIICLATVSPLSAEDGWLTSLEEARKIALKENKDIFVNFTGSDWCGWCIRLHQEVFSTDTWKKEAPKKYILVTLDFPRAKSIDKEQKAYNAKLRDEFQVQGYPSLFLLDAHGRPYAKTGYQSGGPEEYLAHLEKFSSRKTTINKAIKQAKKIDSLEKIFSDYLNPWRVAFGYPQLKEKIVFQDPDNTKGLCLKYSAELTWYYRAKGNKDKSDSYLAIVKKHDPDQGKTFEIEFKIEDITAKYLTKKNFAGELRALKKLFKLKPNGKGAQKIHYRTASIYFSRNKTKQAIENLEKALKAEPDSKLAVQIKDILKEIKK